VALASAAVWASVVPDQHEPLIALKT